MVATMVRRSIALVLFPVLMGGCAAIDSVVTPDLVMVANPVEGIAVRIETVEDARQFQERPPHPDQPSLASSVIGDASVRARAIGRKRNGFGLALGDIRIPEGQTVAGLIGNAITQGFRMAGYRVLSSGQSGYEQAVPISAKINQFWCWVNIGLVGATVSNRTEVVLSAPRPPVTGNLTVSGTASESGMMVVEDDWQKIAGLGLANFAQNLRKSLPAPGVPSVSDASGLELRPLASNRGS